MQLSILDFDYYQNTIDLCLEAEELGYARYWLGEHHSSSQCSNPLLLGALLSTSTDRIRLGSGAVCLSYHNPYRVARDALLIESILPDRFDLGVTKGLPLTDAYAQAIQQGRPSGDYFDLLKRLHTYLTEALPGDTAGSLESEPLVTPPVWILGLSVQSAAWAGKHGAGFCYSLHHAQRSVEGRNVIAEYRRQFRPGPYFTEPRVILVLGGLCATTEREALEWRRRLDTVGPSTDRAQPNFFGSADRALEQIHRYVAEYSADEAMILDHLHGRPDVRSEMYRSLAASSGLVS